MMIKKGLLAEPIELDSNKQETDNATKYKYFSDAPEIPYSEYVSNILQQANTSFSVMYHKIFKQYWHDGKFTARMSQNYVFTDWQKGVYEVFIPTREDPTANLSFFRIAIKVLEKADSETVKAESTAMQRPFKMPMGIIDSELIVLVAPHLKRRGFIRGFRHVNKKGYLTAVVVSTIPEIAFKRILHLLVNFFDKRVTKFLEALGFNAPWQYDYKERSMLYYTYNIIERFSHSIGLTLKTLSHSLGWFKNQLKDVYREIGRQNMAKMAFQTLNKAKEFFNDAGLTVSVDVSKSNIQKKIEYKPTLHIFEERFDGLDFLRKTVEWGKNNG